MAIAATPESKIVSTSGAIEVDALIIGAGFSGLYQLLSLRDKLNLSVQVIEVADEVGGTWYWNRYPGARCDSESHSYQYYFSDELVKEWEWTQRYPDHAEIRQYLGHVAKKFDLKANIKFKTRVTAAKYHEASNRWHITTDAGDTYVAKYFITAVGCLSSANIPKIAGLESFGGEWYHTGQWPHEGVDFTGKRVGIIGTGSTGIQAIPVIAEQAGHLTVFQRTANYSIPSRNAPLTDQFKQFAKEKISDIRHVMHTNTNGHAFRMVPRSAIATPEAERRAIMEKAWAKGGLEFRACFDDILINKDSNDTMAEFVCEKIRAIVRDPAKAEVLADIDHPFATKRPPVDTHYFETYNRDNVSIVNLRKTPIDSITPKGIKIGDQEYELDIIVFATGFDAMTGPLLNINITGKNNTALKDVWSTGPSNYLGLQVPGFPNMFTITGPGSPSVLCNMPVAIEQHVDWITHCIADMQANGLQKIEATAKAANDWVQEVNVAANATLLPQAKHSWYLGANVPGKPRVFMPYAGGMANYRKICDDVAKNSYTGFQRT